MIGNNIELSNEIERLIIKEKYSPYGAISKIKETKEVLRSLQKRYSKTFKDRSKSITIDNGVEFMNSKSVKEMGIKYFYVHSYCSYERESNENNKLIRRFIKKGEDIGKYRKSFIKKIECFMNEYPRKIFNRKSANYVYKKIMLHTDTLTCNL